MKKIRKCYIRDKFKWILSWKWQTRKIVNKTFFILLEGRNFSFKNLSLVGLFAFPLEYFFLYKIMYNFLKLIADYIKSFVWWESQQVP